MLIMKNYIFLISIGIIAIVFLIYTIYNTISEKFTSDDNNNYDYKNDIFMRKSTDLDLLENNSYLYMAPNDVVNTSSVKEFKYTGPTWKNEFNYNNIEVLKAEHKRDSMLEHIRNLECDNKYKTFVNVNNSTFCGGSANKCSAAVDCCGGSSCINEKCTF
jgi:hypothetical protein